MLQATTGVAYSDTSFQDVIQTDDATPKTVYSFPIRPDSVSKLVVDATIFSLDETKLASGNVIAVFGRIGTGNVTRPGTPTVTIQANNFGTPALGFNLIANTSTQSADLVITGQPGVSIRWHLDITARSTP